MSGPAPALRPWRDSQRLAIGVFILARLIFCGYRAAHQSLTTDEAFTFNRFVDGAWSAVYGPYDANNHVLYSLAAKLSVRVLGVSEFALRLPSVLAGLALMVGLTQLLRKLVDRPWVVLVAVVVTGLHPVLLDFSIAARGYGLSIALFVWALYFAVRTSYAAAGLLLGLAVWANLAIVFPALAFAGAWVLAGRGSWRTRTLAAGTMAAAAACVSLLVYAPILRFILAHRDYFYVGYPSFQSALLPLVTTSIHANASFAGLFGSRPAAQVIAAVFLPLIAGFICVSGAVVYRRERIQLIPAVTLALTLAGLAAAHRILRLPYPAERTWLYILILFGMAWTIACAPVRSRILLAVNLAFAVLLGLQFATQIRGDYFLFWAQERHMRQIAEMIQADSSGKPAHSVAISATWWHEPTLEFYRRRLDIVALRKVEQLLPAPLAGYDYYVLSGEDFARAAQAGLVPMFRDSQMGMLLARNPGLP